LVAKTALDVVGFGALNLDVIYRVDDVSQAGLEPGAEVVGLSDDMAHLVETLERLGGPPVSVTAGGSAANTVYTLGRMGFRTGYVGAVGVDSGSNGLLDGLGAVEDLGVVRRGVNGRTLIAVGADGDRSITVFPNANDELGPSDVDQGLLARARIVHLTAFVGPLPLVAQVEAVRGLPSGTMVSLDPGAIYSALGAEALEPLLRHADIVLPGEGELRRLTGEEDRDRGAARLLDMGVGTVVCKLGRRGIHTYWHGGDHLLEAEPVSPSGDSVGAGDVAAAGYLAGVLGGKAPPECTASAHAAAVESLAGFGREAYPDRSLLERMNGR
jgi:ribokinase